VNSLNDTISTYRDNWFNHIRRMDHSHFPWYMLSYKPTGKRSLGCPRKRWISQIWGATMGKSPVREVEEEEKNIWVKVTVPQHRTRFACMPRYTQQDGLLKVVTTTGVRVAQSVLCLD
jgi:hypothetical protein